MKFETIFKSDKNSIIVDRIKELSSETAEQLIDSVDILEQVLDNYYDYLFVNRHNISMEYMRAYYDTLKLSDNAREYKLYSLWETLIKAERIYRKSKEYSSSGKMWIVVAQNILRNLGVLKTEFFIFLVPVRRSVGTIDKYDVAKDLEKLYVKYDEAKKEYVRAINTVKKVRGVS